MKRIIFIIAYFTISFGAYAQEKSVKHIIDRGETLSSIAEQYGISTDKIIEVNPDASDFIYVGMELDIPCESSSSLNNSISKTLETIKQLESLQNSEIVSNACEEADRLLEIGQNRKAIKEYNKVLKTYGSTGYSCVDAYYGRGIAYYNQGKWRRAIKDLETTISDPRCDETIHSHCTTLLSDARKYRQQQLQERGEAWGEFFGVLATTAAATGSAIVANQQAKDLNTSNTNTSVLSKYSSLADHYNPQIDPNLMGSMLQNAYEQSQAEIQERNNLMMNMINNAAQHVEAENQAEYEYVHMHNPDITYEQFMMMKAQAYQDVQNSELESSGSSSYSNSFSTTISQNDCKRCYGSGICQTCNGKGWYYYEFDNSKHLDCPNCDYNHNGKCAICHGTGHQ